MGYHAFALEIFNNLSVTAFAFLFLLLLYKSDLVDTFALIVNVLLFFSALLVGIRQINN